MADVKEHDEITTAEEMNEVDGQPIFHANEGEGEEE